MLTAKANSLECWCDGARVVGYRNLVYLSLFGEHNAVRGIWAYLLTDRRGSIEVGNRWYSLEDKGAYCSVSAKIDKRNLHIVVLEERATSQISPFSSMFYMVGDDVSHFFPKLDRMCPVPFRPTWGAKLWEIGQAEGLIQPLDGFGPMGYSVDTSEAWAKVVVAKVKDGTLG